MGISINDKERVISWRLKTVGFEFGPKDRPLPVYPIKSVLKNRAPLIEWLTFEDLSRYQMFAMKKGFLWKL